MSQGREAFRKATHVSRETLERFDVYAALLLRWSRSINLVSRSTLEDVWHRHFLDSAQLLILGPANATKWADLGSGAGFPGMVVALLLSESGNTEMTLVESDKRKAAFLRAVSRETGVRVRIIDERIDDVPPLEAAVLSARALAPLDMLLSYTARHLSAGGIGLFPKGARYQEEIDRALESWVFDCETHPSLAESEGVVLKISEIRRA